MVALVEHVQRGPIAVHMTYLNPDGTGKAASQPGKAFLGPVGGGAVRFGYVRPGDWLILGEGIETAASIASCCAMPAWAALSAGGIKRLVLPPEATHVIICADNDANGVGQRAADEAAERLLAQGRRVRVITPPNADSDFNDVLLGGPNW
jgi:putative DNA primase/helicase